MRISEEWAKQLIYEYVGHDLDFASMGVYAMQPEVSSFKITAPDESAYYYSPCDLETLRVKEDVVYMQGLYDPVNQEVTTIGYSRLGNIIGLGETEVVKHCKLCGQRMIGGHHRYCPRCGQPCAN
jgi:hypothetical protein